MSRPANADTLEHVRYFYDVGRTDQWKEMKPLAITMLRAVARGRIHLADAIKMFGGTPNTQDLMHIPRYSKLARLP